MKTEQRRLRERTHDAVRIECVLDRFVELHKRVVVPIVGVGDLIVIRDVRAVLSVAQLCGVGDEDPQQLLGADSFLGLGTVKEDL